MRRSGTAGALILALAVLALSASALMAGESWHQMTAMEYACPSPEDVEPLCREPREAAPCRTFTPASALIALGIGILAFILGRASAKVPPLGPSITTAINNAGTARINEANLHGIGIAVPLLTKLQNDAISKVQADLQKKGLW